MITNKQYEKFDYLLKYYNKELFKDKLNDCMITMNRRSRARAGFFISHNWKNKLSENETCIHEIGLNPDYFFGDDAEWHSTLVHEIVHLWQEDYGKPSRRNYHNKQFSEKMEEVGLMTSSTGKPGGARTGRSMSHYIIPDGPFFNAYNRLTEKEINYISSFSIIPSKDTEVPEVNQKIKKNESKSKYTCSCGNNVWGKPGLIIICGVCNKNYCARHEHQKYQ